MNSVVSNLAHSLAAIPAGVAIQIAVAVGIGAAVPAQPSYSTLSIP
jgi:hypothetical protein